MPRVAHFEIHAENPQRAIDFYSALLEWTFQAWGPPGQYWLIKTGEDGERGIDGGLVPRRGSAPQTGQPVNAFVCTVEVRSIDAYVERAVRLGARVALPKMAVPGVGWLAYVHDPEGNIFGMLQNDRAAA